MRYGYIRSKKQSEYSLERQRNALKQYDLAEVIEEKSGNDLDNLLDILQAGDELYVESVERLTRSTIKLIGITKLVREKGIKLYVGGKPFELPTLLG